MTFTSTQDSLILGFTLTLSAVSFIGASLIIVSYVLFPPLRTNSFTLVTLMSLADILVIISYFLGDPTSGTGLCTFQGLLQQFAELSSILWSTIIAWTLYTAVVHRRDTSKMLHKFVVVGFGVPFLLALFPLTTTSYDNTGAWCWITADDVAGQLWRWLIFYGPLWSAIGFNSYSVYIVRKGLKSAFAGADEMPKKYKDLINKLKWYPIILVFCWFWGTVNRLQNAFNPGNEVFWLYFMQAFFRSTQGALNAVAYGAQGSVREEWARWLSDRPRMGWLVEKVRPPMTEAPVAEGEDDLSTDETVL
ncbi:hypothetical protein TrST_g1633 [Triparma strigata]|uniref:G-protein coupled receptors family 2 profile 2 domain-containing protein n=1 Tax=Triparma strigata TaxID=1606541 RepID=A0A9W7E5P5_9STRA|nr:hypothetical protein TrST_g1633 [Triparma strigata]